MLLLITDDVHPGYVKLKVLDSLQEGHTCTSRYDNVWYSSKHLVNYVRQRMPVPVINIGPAFDSGPAINNSSSVAELEAPTDAVLALRCSWWPLQACEWLTRKRHCNWPSRKLLEKAKAEGCLLVPVGFTSSPDEDIEWRLSFSLLERELVWSWNDTQRQCLFFLKLMLKNYINKRVPHGLSSYHLKTLMLWMVEETRFDEWVPETLTKHITKALTKLLEWVRVGNCPSYFIRENNLFDGKLECSAKSKIIESIQELVGMGFERYLISQCQAKCNTEAGILKLYTAFPSMTEFQARQNTIVQGNELLCDFMLKRRTVILYHNIIDGNNLDTMAAEHERYIELGEKFLVNANSDDREFMQLLLNYIHSSLGSQLFAKAMQTQDGQIREQLMSEALCELELGQHVDALSGKLKLATFHYMNRDYHKVLDIVGNALGDCGPNTILYNSMNNFPYHINEVVFQDLSQFKMSLTRTLTKHYACEVLFFPTEALTVPHRMRFERLIPRNASTVDVAFVADSMVYAHYLQCSCYFHLKQADKLLDVLQKFHSCVKQDYKRIPLKSTALNLLAHCCFMAGKYNSGFNMLRKSIKVCPDPRQNGALWILGVVVYDSLRSRGYTMEVNEHVILYSR